MAYDVLYIILTNNLQIPILRVNICYLFLDNVSEMFVKVNI
jgi:hypothetical protein